jgi:hypothetical protein
MFDKLVKRSNAVWIYSTGCFAEQRRAFFCELSKEGRSLLTLRNLNKLLLVIAERVNIRQRTPITERQIVRAVKDWVETSCAPSSTTETQDIQRRRFVFVAKHWFRFLGKWCDPIRNPQFKSELDSFLKELRDETGYTDQTLSTRETGRLHDVLWMTFLKLKSMHTRQDEEFPAEVKVVIGGVHDRQPVAIDHGPESLHFSMLLAKILYNWKFLCAQTGRERKLQKSIIRLYLI